MDTIVVKINGLRSAACVSSIEYKLQQLPNMQAVHVDYVTSEALLRSFERIDLEKVKAIIEENGFTMDFPEKIRETKRSRKQSKKHFYIVGLIFAILLVVEVVIFFKRYAFDMELVKIAAAGEMILTIIGLGFAYKHYYLW